MPFRVRKEETQWATDMITHHHKSLFGDSGHEVIFHVRRNKGIHVDRRGPVVNVDIARGKIQEMTSSMLNKLLTQVPRRVHRISNFKHIVFNRTAPFNQHNLGLHRYLSVGLYIFI